MSRAPRLLAVLLASAGALLLAALVVRVSVTEALLELGPEPAAMISPRHPGVLLGRANERFRLAGEPDPETMAAALDGFDAEPLSEVPFLIGARRALGAGDAAAAERLLAIALRRHPRSRPGLLLRLELAVRAGRPDEAALAMSVLSRLFSQAHPLLVAELARMVEDPASREAARQVLETDPALRAQVLNALAQRDTDPELILALAGPELGEEAEWQRLLLDAMVRRGRPGPALALWQRFVGDGAEARPGGVYDPDFAGRPGPPPFNWTFQAGGDGFAEPGASGLHVEYYGRRDFELARQLLVLPPGRHALAFEVTGQAEGPSRLAWTLTCLADGRALGTVRIGEIGFARRRVAGAFEVPAAGCSAQWLRLIGSAAEFPKPEQATISALRLTRQGG